MSAALPSPSVPAGRAGRWLWLAGVAGLVFAARAREIHLFASDTPILDQWDAEARAILVPWLQGKLAWRDFIAPHNEHVPLWTRLSAWLQAALLGRWDPPLQATCNAALHGLFAGTVALWLRRSLPRWPAAGLSLLLVGLAGLPFSWENSTWGFQVHTPLALLLVFAHIHGSFVHRPGAARWWLAQAAGLAAFFTYGSMWAAPAAVGLTSLWIAPRERRRWLAGALLAAGGLAIVLFARSQQPSAHTAALTAHSPREFLAALLLQLGWPAPWAGSCIVLGLPALLLAFRVRRQRTAEPVDRITLALAVWGVAQAAAFAFARGGGYIGFVSRYGDLLALGVLANAVALWRLLEAPAPRRWLLGALAAAWVVTLAAGLQQISTRGHTEFYHAHAEAWGRTRHEAVRQYLATKDRKFLSTDAARAVLHPNPNTVAASLDQPGLADLLPASLRPGPAPHRGDRISAAAAGIRSHWLGVGAAAAALLAAGFFLSRWSPAVATAPLAPTRDAWLAWTLGAIAVGAGALVLLWPHPFRFGAKARWLALVNPPGTVQGLTFRITTETRYPKDNLVGGADLWPIEFRNHFFGTELDGPAFTGIAESTPITINSPWLVIPYAGFPVSPGNGLRLRVVDTHGTLLDEIGCPGPNPPDIDFWAVDVQAYPGCLARVILYDARNDAQGWVAAAAPQAVNDPAVADQLRRDRALEPTGFGQDSLVLISLSAALLGWGAGRAARQRRPSW